MRVVVLRGLAVFFGLASLSLRNADIRDRVLEPNDARGEWCLRGDAFSGVFEWASLRRADGFGEKTGREARSRFAGDSRLADFGCARRGVDGAAVIIVRKANVQDSSQVIFKRSHSSNILFRRSVVGNESSAGIWCPSNELVIHCISRNRRDLVWLFSF